MHALHPPSSFAHAPSSFHRMQHTACERGIHLRIFVEGHDARAGYLSELLRKKGHEISDHACSDLIVLSIPRTALSMDTFSQLPKEKKIICGLTDDAFLSLAKEKNWRLYHVLQDEKYTLQNAILSAEGALYAAMRQADFSVGKSSCLVIGFGRIGKALTGMLRGLGAQVIVAARREESRIAAGDGIAIGEIPLYLPNMQLIFNTVPSPILGKEWISLINPDALMIELASAPYGIDLSAAQEMHLRAWGEWGIPGRYCPKAAAELLFEYLERKVLT